MRLVTVALGDKAQLDGPYWAVRCLQAGPAAAVSLDDGVPLPFFGAYSIPAPSPDRPFRKVVLFGAVTAQLAEDVDEELTGQAGVQQGGSKRTLVSTELVPANVAWQSALLAPALERGIVLLVEVGNEITGRDFILQGYDDDGRILIWESALLSVNTNTRNRLLVSFLASTRQTGGTTPTSNSGTYDGRAATNGGSDRGWASPFCRFMGLRSPAANGSLRLRVWL